MNKTISTLSISSILLALAACGSDNRSSNVDSSASSSSAINNVSTVLDGVWFKDCSAEEPFEPDSFYETVEVTFANGSIATDIHIYTDSDCTNPMPLAPNPTARGTFSIGASFTSDDGVTVQALDIHITEANGAIFDERGYNIFYIDNDQLFTGEEDAETPEERPTMLDFTSAYIRQ